MFDCDIAVLPAAKKNLPAKDGEAEQSSRQSRILLARAYQPDQGENDMAIFVDLGGAFN